MSVFPGAVPPAGTATPSDTLAAAGHTALHNTSYDEIRALATKLGTGSSTPTSGTVLRGNGAGTSAWGQVALTTDVTGTLPVANGGTGGTNLTFPAGPDTLVGRNTTDTLTNKTLTAPVIADFTNAAHDHGDADDAGPIVSSAIPAKAVNDSQLVYGKVRTRQGGSATNWGTAGTTAYDYSASNTFMQAGTIASDASPKTVTFPTAFNQVPIVVAIAVTAAVNNVFVRLNAITATNFTIQCLDAGGSPITTETVNWIAIGE